MWIQSSNLNPRFETFAEELGWFRQRMPCYVTYFSEKSGAFTASSNGRNFLSRQNEQAGLFADHQVCGSFNCYFLCAEGPSW